MIDRAEGKLEQTKKFFMELVVMLSLPWRKWRGHRSNCWVQLRRYLSRLAALRDDEELAAWLHEILERIMDSIRSAPVDANEAQLSRAAADRQPPRQRAGPRRRRGSGHVAFAFSRLFRRYFGRTFSQTRVQSRVDYASELLLQTDKPLKLIALECGFSDQSHLTKVFRRHYRTTPLRYRHEHQNTTQ